MSCLVFFVDVHNKEKEKETQNKINKEKGKENRIRPSPSFTTLTSSNKVSIRRTECIVV